jgi:lysophospholipase L1-like esterase
MRGRHAAPHSRHLFSGFMKCGRCGGAVVAVAGGHGSSRYGCQQSWRNGVEACANRLTVRAKIADINQRLGGLSDFTHVYYLDIGSKFLDDEGVFKPGVFRADNLHPAAPGYVIWADAVKDAIATLMK